MFVSSKTLHTSNDTISSFLLACTPVDTCNNYPFLHKIWCINTHVLSQLNKRDPAAKIYYIISNHRLEYYKIYLRHANTVINKKILRREYLRPSPPSPFGLTQLVRFLTGLCFFGSNPKHLGGSLGQHRVRAKLTSLFPINDIVEVPWTDPKKNEEYMIQA